MHNTPTKDELKELPIRAIVAYAVRHARRVQPLVCSGEEVDKKEIVAIHAALNLAERFATGESVPSDDLALAKKIVYQTDDATAYFAVASASASTQMAAWGYAFEAANAAGALMGEQASFSNLAAKKDYEKLVCLNLSDEGMLDLSENGPLGPYWTEGKIPNRYSELATALQALLSEPLDEINK